MLKRAGSKTITIDGQRYRYVISEVGRPTTPVVSLALTVQHAFQNGARLRITGLEAVRVPESESKWFMGRTVAAPLSPRDVESLIRSALARGWQARAVGRQFSMDLGC